MQQRECYSHMNLNFHFLHAVVSDNAADWLLGDLNGVDGKISSAFSRILYINSKTLKGARTRETQILIYN